MFGFKTIFFLNIVIWPTSYPAKSVSGASLLYRYSLPGTGSTVSEIAIWYLRLHTQATDPKGAVSTTRSYNACFYGCMQGKAASFFIFPHESAVLAVWLFLQRRTARTAWATAHKVTPSSVALRERSERKHCGPRSWPSTACARPLASVSPNSKGKFKQSSACQSPSSSCQRLWPFKKECEWPRLRNGPVK